MTFCKLIIAVTSDGPDFHLGVLETAGKAHLPSPQCSLLFFTLYKVRRPVAPSGKLTAASSFLLCTLRSLSDWHSGFNYWVALEGPIHHSLLHREPGDSLWYGALGFCLTDFIFSFSKFLITCQCVALSHLGLLMFLRHPARGPRHLILMKVNLHQQPE